MALTKNTTIKELDDWQLVATETLVVGAVYDTSPNYDTALYIELAPVGSQDVGVEINIEVSYADDNWVSLREVRGTIGILATTTVDGNFSAGVSAIDLVDATAGNIDVVGNKWFILSTTVPFSQSVRTKSVAGNTVTLCHDLIRTASTGFNCYDRVDEWFVEIPIAASKVRILYNNTSPTQDAYVTSRVSEVTALK
jgi:hypothetical protein